MNKKFIYALLYIALMMSCSPAKTDEKASEIDTIPMLIHQIQQCAKLYTTKVEVHKIITHSDTKNLSGSILNQKFNVRLPLGERKVTIPISATIKAYIDFSDFSYKNIKKNGKKLEIILPDPRIDITSTRINHNEMKMLIPLLRRKFNDKELSNFELQGREAIVKEIPQMNLINTSQIHAAKLLIPFFCSMGYNKEDIIITFRKDFNFKEPLSLINNTIIIHEKNTH